MPAGFEHDFDAHIYFPSDKTSFIESLRKKLIFKFESSEVFVGDVIPEPIGPHTMPMLEVNFSNKRFAEMVPWLSIERGSLNVLVHPQTGDDYFDHTQGAIWLGRPVDLKLELFPRN